MHIPWRYPFLPPPAPDGPSIVGPALARREFDVIADQLLAHMDKHGIEKTVIMRGLFPALNATLGELVATHPDRFIAFGSWELEPLTGSPPRESDSGLKALEESLQSPAFRGAGEYDLGRFNAVPPEQAYTGFIPTLELCRTYGAPIMFHMCWDPGPIPTKYKDPLMLEPLVQQFPDVNFMIAHMGKYDTTYFESALMLARKFPNVLLTTSTTRMEFVERAVDELGAERIVFGSDWSIQHGILGLEKGYDIYERNLDIVRNARIGDGDKRLILGENLAKLLNI